MKKKQLEMTEADARKVYPGAPKELQAILVSTFGEGIKEPKSYKDIKTYDDAVEERAVDEDDIIYPTDRPHIVAFKKLCHIIKVINGNWKLEQYNHDQPKYYPYFTVSPSGSGFSVSDYGDYYTSSDVGSRLYTESSEKALYLGTQFRDLYEQYLLIK